MENAGLEGSVIVASVASLLLTTEGRITDLPEPKPAAAPPMPHGDF